MDVTHLVLFNCFQVLCDFRGSSTAYMILPSTKNVGLQLLCLAILWPRLLPLHLVA